MNVANAAAKHKGGAPHHNPGVPSGPRSNFRCNVEVAKYPSGQRYRGQSSVGPRQSGRPGFLGQPHKGGEGKAIMKTTRVR
jgi:hypothetical protein